MKPSNGFKYILVLIDVYTLFTYAVALKQKKSSGLKEELNQFFSKFGKPETFESDKGGEFTGLDTFFSDKNIRFRLKKGRVKAVYAEAIIYHLKRKIYIEMRHKNSVHWEEFLPEIVNSMNEAKHPGLGGLRPVDLTSKEKAAQVDVALNYNNLPRFHDFFFKDKNKIAQASPLQPNDYVYIANFDPRVRGFHVQVRTVC